MDCGSNSNNSPSVGQEKVTSLDGTEAGNDISSASDTSNSNGSTSTKSNNGTKRILSVYFSQTGATEKAAKRIQELTKGDILKIKTVTTYPNEYNELTDVAKKQKEESARPKLAAEVENIGNYDVIFVGIQSGGIQHQWQ
jgi:hypothetical protein